MLLTKLISQLSETKGISVDLFVTDPILLKIQGVIAKEKNRAPSPSPSTLLPLSSTPFGRFKTQPRLEDVYSDFVKKTGHLAQPLKILGAGAALVAEERKKKKVTPKEKLIHEAIPHFKVAPTQYLREVDFI